MPAGSHGWSYTYASLNTAGNTATNDYCMAPLRMAGQMVLMVTTVQAAILIGRTGHTITSLPT